ncbi:beta-ketoacyl-ACP synthase III [Streptomyces rubradiris]|uniref:Beta-ketoacyl-[acyl-carrier-protein] synthase III n=1 Tax=Streptomyces rubradiris TaxID=285531 RepID=A0ABQ3R7Q9_STRRR|nr:beta-ketoacyl-ACP synthase III [Streptomyces rubradiris]GHH16256.1 3-oxoacyl-[acyl-carrier-protein] synthase 3 [Streptomyces rubradiris]GHI51857.1 3-oxoacyl-[acyl-carrier-protein] synthase 3 [Streptomyces rubradiris]
MTRGAILSGLGTWLPPQVVTNDMLSSELDTSDEWIRTRTGIGRRHIASPGMSTGHLATEAARRALKSAGTDRVDVVIVATSTPDRPCPATAPVVASALGLTGTGAFDVAAVCTGFVYALATAAGLITGQVADSALVIGADTFSTILDPRDRTTRVIFGDGAGAVVLRAGDRAEEGALRGFDLGSDGTGVDLITVPGGGSEQRLSGTEAAPGDQYFHMDGPQVFTRAVRYMTGSVRKVLDAAALAPEDLAHLVPHQANVRILDTCARELGLPAERVVKNIDRVGNTVAASIPLALAAGAADGRLRAGDPVVLTGFGGGLTWGSALLTWPGGLTVIDG